ncbi:MAG: hypothetical protein NVS1B13_15870 [Flavisolibacter sp.]
MIPISKISSLSTGEFVGMVADNPDEPIELKTFCAHISKEDGGSGIDPKSMKELPDIREIDQGDILDNFIRIKEEVLMMVESELERMLSTPELVGLVIKKINN